MKELILTLQFLTRIPIPIEVEWTKDRFAKGILYFPIVGLIVGAFNVAVYWALSRFFPHGVSIVGALLSNVLITGGLHLDGLADTCDGIFSARSRERMLEIMKDSRIGTHGALALFFDLLFRTALLSSFSELQIYAALLLAPVLGRASLGLLIAICKDARDGKGMGSLYMAEASQKRGISCYAIGGLLIASMLQLKGVLIIGCGLIFLLLYRKYMYVKLGGITGDVLGAANECFEIVLMMLLSLGGNK